MIDSMVDRIKLCVIGLGYVGLPLAIEFSKKLLVVGFDTDEEKILNLKKRLFTWDRTIRNWKYTIYIE